MADDGDWVGRMTVIGWGEEGGADSESWTRARLHLYVCSDAI